MKEIDIQVQQIRGWSKSKEQKELIKGKNIF